MTNATTARAATAAPTMPTTRSRLGICSLLVGATLGAGGASEADAVMARKLRRKMILSDPRCAWTKLAVFWRKRCSSEVVAALAPPLLRA